MPAPGWCAGGDAGAPNPQLLEAGDDETCFGKEPDPKWGEGGDPGLRPSDEQGDRRAGPGCGLSGRCCMLANEPALLIPRGISMPPSRAKPPAWQVRQGQAGKPLQRAVGLTAPLPLESPDGSG